MVISKRTRAFNVWRLFCFLSLFILLIGASLQHVQGQSINPLQSSTIPFIEPPMPTGFEGRPTFCNFVQSPNYQHTVWQCMFIHQPSVSDKALGFREWFSTRIIPVTTDGILGLPYSFSFEGLQYQELSTGKVLAINNQHDLFTDPAQESGLADERIEQGPYNIFKLSSSGNLRSGLLKYDLISRFFDPKLVYDAWSIGNKTWLIEQRFNTRSVPIPSFVLLDETVNKINSYDLKEFHVKLGTLISKNGDIIHWGIAADQRRDKTLIVCQSPDLKVISKTTIDYPPEQHLIGLALPNNEVLLLKRKTNNNRLILSGWIINTEQGCQQRFWGDFSLTDDAYPLIYHVEYALLVAADEIIILYTEQLDLRNDGFAPRPAREKMRANLVAMKFNFKSKKTIWTNLVISKSDPASEAFSQYLMFANGPGWYYPRHQQGISVAYLPEIQQLFIQPLLPQNQDRLQYFPPKPRIYQLSLE